MHKFAIIFWDGILNILLEIKGFLKPECEQELSQGDPMGCSTPGLPVHHQLPRLAQTRIHRIQPFHPLSSPSPPTFNLSQHQGLFQWGHKESDMTEQLDWTISSQQGHPGRTDSRRETEGSEEKAGCTEHRLLQPFGRTETINQGY